MKYMRYTLLLLTLLMGKLNAQNEGSIALHQNWTYSEVDGSHTGQATVPGTIHTDLLNNGSIPDPYYRTNEKDLQWIDKKDWVYRTTFYVDSATLARQRITLCFYGLDTYADVSLNNRMVLQADNMHRQWTVDAKQDLKAGNNTLEVYLHSPIKKGLELYEASPYAYPASNDQSENGELGDKKVSVFTRKAGYHYGWDWGPRLVTSGIWRPVELRFWNEVSIPSVYMQQPMVSDSLAKLKAQVEVWAEQPLHAKLQVINLTDSQVMRSIPIELKKGENRLEVPFEISQPKLWWSNGLGTPHLYDFEVRITGNDKTLASHTLTTGIRSIKLVREKDADGESFLFELNGVRVFAKGANYIPNDCFLPRVTHADYEKVIADAVDANMNMLRIWGGGIYEDNYFYELCDKNGIMVWQDFMFACSMYPGNNEMLENIRHEAIDNVTRLRNHPSIVLWCGNNEINTAWHYYGEGGWGWKKDYTPQQQQEINTAYLDIFHKVLPEVVETYTDNVDYWPSSPQAGYQPEMHASDKNTSGDMHYWGVWHARHPFEDFDQYKARFMSEYGFQSFPSFETVKTYTLPEDYDIESEVMAAHQRSGIGNLRIKEYMSWYYKVPDDFEQFLYMSQVLQAEGMQYGIEAHRRAMPYCMGSLYWQLNDCWPVASWSSTDYYHNWKAMHYKVRDAFKPIIVSTVNTPKTVEIYGISDLQEDRSASLEMTLMDFDGDTLVHHIQSVNVPANTSTLLTSIPFNSFKGWKPNRQVLVVKLIGDGQVWSEKFHYFKKTKDLKLSTPDVEIKHLKEEGNDYLQLKTNTLTKSIYLYSSQPGLVTDDNFFDLLPGQKKKIKVLKSSATTDSTTVNFRHISR